MAITPEERLRRNRAVRLHVIVALLGLLTPIMTGKILGDLVPRAQKDTILQYVVILLVTAVAAAALSLIQNLASLRIVEGLQVKHMTPTQTGSQILAQGQV